MGSLESTDKVSPAPVAPQKLHFLTLGHILIGVFQLGTKVRIELEANTS